MFILKMQPPFRAFMRIIKDIVGVGILLNKMPPAFKQLCPKDAVVNNERFILLGRGRAEHMRRSNRYDEQVSLLDRYDLILNVMVSASFAHIADFRKIVSMLYGCKRFQFSIYENIHILIEKAIAG